ncbi:pirin family protein [Vibrio sp. SCSIO 43136]|uniref:pirin family protein n=1 Tax=Vibrio sp. SCSIO 43136 TaxID=2819101 RepID=UPI002076082A|nr:pirin family protein [Vibrio sp. SCSIO 43136]USD68305.1 pirin family protein [Vibrio sp. SCSIO 43136]
MMTTRNIEQLIKSHATSDGAGVAIQRVAGFNNKKFSPFLMLDELYAESKEGYIGGFPPHPHRGIETLTYMRQGHFQHKDHMGNVGELRSGGAQWMAAGRGVIHSEMPMMEDGAMHGFQLWINQPAKNKMQPAEYMNLPMEELTHVQNEQLGELSVIAGSADLGRETVVGPLDKTGVPLSVMDWRAHQGQSIQLNTATSDQVLVYVYAGSIESNGQAIERGTMALFSLGEALELSASVHSGALILVGQPINEPVVHYGPFVMNTMEEIEQTIEEYQKGLFETY